MPVRRSPDRLLPAQVPMVGAEPAIRGRVVGRDSGGLSGEQAARRVADRDGTTSLRRSN